MIDLKAFDNETEEVKLLSGEIIHLKKPTQKIILDMMTLEEDAKKANTLQAMEKMNFVIKGILELNTEGKKFTTEEVKANFSYNLAFSFLQAYMKWATEIQSQTF